MSLGDPAGIGPEIIVGSWARRNAEQLYPFAVIGGAQVLRRAAHLCGLEVPIACIERAADAPAVFAQALPVVGDGDAICLPGKPDASGARLALASLETAAALSVSGAAAAVVTGPVSKAELAAVGFFFPGQTEFVAHACGVAAEDAVMMLAGPQLRTVPLTVHCALADVPALLTIDLICRRIRIVDQAMRKDFGIAAPRIAVCGLNPHAGEKGRMGREEIDVVVPALEVLRAEGVAVTGPHPADTLFAPHKRGTYDVAIGMYHDQALVPLKTLDFDQGVNVTLGLPIVRTSPDHGTAFDIAGTGRAEPGAMIAALRMAAEMAERRARA